MFICGTKEKREEFKRKLSNLKYLLQIYSIRMSRIIESAGSGDLNSRETKKRSQLVLNYAHTYRIALRDATYGVVRSRSSGAAFYSSLKYIRVFIFLSI